MDRNKAKLTFLLLIAVLPISLATWMFNAREEAGGMGPTTNKGELILPPLDITELDLRDGQGELVYRTFEEEVAGLDPEDYEPRPWLLVTLGGADCGEQCRQRLFYLRQLHARLAADAPRLRRWYLNADGGELAPDTAAHFREEFPSMGVGQGSRERILENLARTLKPGASPIEDHYSYVVDPVGNVMLYFTPENSPEDILQDIEKLLDQSSLG